MDSALISTLIGGLLAIAGGVIASVLTNRGNLKATSTAAEAQARAAKRERLTIAVEHLQRIGAEYAMRRVSDSDVWQGITAVAASADVVIAGAVRDEHAFSDLVRLARDRFVEEADTQDAESTLALLHFASELSQLAADWIRGDPDVRSTDADGYNKRRVRASGPFPPEEGPWPRLRL